VKFKFSFKTRWSKLFWNSPNASWWESVPLINYLTQPATSCQSSNKTRPSKCELSISRSDMHTYVSKKALATFKAKWNNISNDFQALKRFIHASERQTNTHHIPKIFVYIYYNITHKYLVHRSDGIPYTGRWMWWEFNAQKWKVLEM